MGGGGGKRFHPPKTLRPPFSSCSLTLTLAFVQFFRISQSEIFPHPLSGLGRRARAAQTWENARPLQSLRASLGHTTAISEQCARTRQDKSIKIFPLPLLQLYHCGGCTRTTYVLLALSLWNQVYFTALRGPATFAGPGLLLLLFVFTASLRQQLLLLSVRDGSRRPINIGRRQTLLSMPRHAPRRTSIYHTAACGWVSAVWSVVP